MPARATHPSRRRIGRITSECPADRAATSTAGAAEPDLRAAGFTAFAAAEEDHDAPGRGADEPGAEEDASGELPRLHRVQVLRIADLRGIGARVRFGAAPEQLEHERAAERSAADTYTHPAHGRQ